MKGQKRRLQRAYGNDSIAYSSENDSLRPFTNSVNEVQTYHTKTPIYTEITGNRQNMASVRHSVRDNQELPYAAWPGPNVALDSTGLESEYSGVQPTMYHGLFEGPMPGQKVAVAFAHGDSNDPIVVEKYSTQSSGLTSSDVTFTTPFQKFNISYRDIGLGHFTGSYINLRADLPMPGAIEIYSSGKIFVESDFGYEAIIGVGYTMDVAETWSIGIDTANYSISSSTGAYQLEVLSVANVIGPEGAAWNINIDSTKYEVSGVLGDINLSTNGTINIGVESLLEPALKGDSTETLLSNLITIFNSTVLTTNGGSASPALISALEQWVKTIPTAKSERVNIS